MSTAQPAARAVSPDTLIALSEEIAALVRAGVPLESGLGAMRFSESREARELAEVFADELRRGSSLSNIMERQAGRFPPLFRAVIAAGLRSGRLPDVLETLTRFARALREIRRQLLLALIYPGTILALAYMLFLFTIGGVGMEFVAMHRDSGLRPRFWTDVIVALNETMHVWMWIPPVLALLFLAWLWVSRRRLVPRTALGRLTLGCVPWMRGAVENFHRSTFADLLALLVENGVPVGDALLLAGEATGEPRYIEASRELADRVHQGGALSEAVSRQRVFPPFMRWMIGTAERQGSLADSLRQLAEMYRRRALIQAEWIRVMLPVLLVLVVGGATVLLYALGIFYPLTRTLFELTLE
jgi:general secretion pathway protein F